MMIRVADWGAYNTFIQHRCPEGNITNVDLSERDSIGFDLTIKGIDVREGGASLFQTNKKFTLKPNTCVVLETCEQVSTGKSVFGFICSRASLTARGLIVSNLKVDPNYSDTLYVTAFNAGAQSVELKVGEPFCTLVFCRNESECHGEARRPDPSGLRSGLAERAKKVAPYALTYVGSVATAILAIWTVFQGGTGN